ncbi:MAG: DHHA1 domain-containing protein [Ferribacterium limneticum]
MGSSPCWHTALDLVAKRAPGQLIRFGGHPMAAGATVNAENFEKFKSLFAEVAGKLLAPADLTRTLETDGNLEGSYISLATARLLENEIWGQGFPAPLFMDDFEVEQQRVLKEKHLKLRLRKGDTRIDAIQFNFSTPSPATAPASPTGWRSTNTWASKARS